MTTKKNLILAAALALAAAANAAVTVMVPMTTNGVVLVPAFAFTNNLLTTTNGALLQTGSRNLTNWSGITTNLVVQSSGGVATNLYVVGGMNMDSNQPAPVWQEGRVFYDTAQHTLAYYNDNANMTLNVGAEETIRVRNRSGSTISDGSAVYISGAQGQLPTISLALGGVSGYRSIGLTTVDMNDGDFGYVTTGGLVNSLNTSAFQDGAVLYPSTNSPGGFQTNGYPGATQIGYVAYSHNNQGKILVNVVPNAVMAVGQTNWPASAVTNQIQPEQIGGTLTNDVVGTAYYVGNGSIDIFRERGYVGGAWTELPSQNPAGWVRKFETAITQDGSLWTNISSAAIVDAPWLTTVTNVAYATNAATAAAGWPTQWPLSSITNAAHLTNWAALSTNVVPQPQTNISYTAVTNAPWLSNNATGVTLTGTFTGNGAGLTNIPAAAITGATWQRGTENLTNWSALATNQLPTTNGFVTASITNGLQGALGYTPLTNTALAITNTLGAVPVQQATHATNADTVATITSAQVTNALPPVLSVGIKGNATYATNAGTATALSATNWGGISNAASGGDKLTILENGNVGVAGTVTATGLSVTNAIATYGTPYPGGGPMLAISGGNYSPRIVITNGSVIIHSVSGNSLSGHANAYSATNIGAGNSLAGHANAYYAKSIDNGNSLAGYYNAYSATSIGTGNSLAGHANAYYAISIGAGNSLAGHDNANSATNIGYGNSLAGYANARSATSLGNGNSLAGHFNAYSATNIGAGNSLAGHANAYYAKSIDNGNSLAGYANARSATSIGTGNSLAGHANAYSATSIGTGNIMHGMWSESPYGPTVNGVLNLGSLIFGTGLNTNNAASYGPSGGRVGINATNLTATLTVGGGADVAGTVTATNYLLSTVRWKDAPMTFAYVANGGLSPTLTVLTNGINLQTWADNQYLDGIAQINHDIAPSNSALYTELHAHLLSATAPAADANRTQLRFVWTAANIGGAAIPVRSNQVEVVLTPGFMGHTIVDAGHLAATNFWPNISAIYTCTITRLAASGSNYSGGLNLTADVHYPVDRFGSASDTSP